jgi:DNA modification methylase
LTTKTLCRPGDLVLDPFCGSGTVLLEALLAQRNSLGADANPLARLISRVKVTPLSPESLHAAAKRLRAAFRPVQHPPPDVVNLRYWFSPHVTSGLISLRAALDTIDHPDIRNFMLVAFSRCVRHLSLADPRVSVPVRLRVDRYPRDHWLRQHAKRRLKYLRRVDVASEFFTILEANVERMAILHAEAVPSVVASIPYTDARRLFDTANDASCADQSVDFVLTSPPYGAAQKYIRACSLNLGWLGLCQSDQLKAHEAATIGREHFHKLDYQILKSTGIASADRLLGRIYAINPLRAHLMATYLLEMQLALREVYRVLKANAYAVLVLGSNQVSGRTLRTHEYLIRAAQDIGFSVVLRLVDNIKTRGLMTRRNTTAGMITRESVVVLQKTATSANDVGRAKD